jgi:glutamate mutase epsilon subunit
MDKSKITVHLPFSAFINKNKNLAEILEKDIQAKILTQAEEQMQQLKEIIDQVKAIKKVEDKEPSPVMAEESETAKFKRMMQAKKSIQSEAPDLRSKVSETPNLPASFPKRNLKKKT